MRTIYLIRHGEKRSDSPDPALTEKGHLQAKRTGLFLRQFPITKIVASPKLRTQQTASHIANALALPIETDHRLVERIDFGAGEYSNREDFFTEWQRATHDRNFVPRAGDSSHATGKRIDGVIEELETNTDNDAHIVLVTHGGAIADYLRNTFPEEITQQLIESFPEGKDYRVDECSVTVLKKEKAVHEMIRCHSVLHLHALEE